MDRQLPLLGIVLALTLAGCGGSSTVAATRPVWVSVPAPPPAARPAGSAASLTLTIPAPRTLQYVSPSAASIRVNSYVVSGGAVSGGIYSTTIANVAAPACTMGSPNVCTFGVTGPVGQATFGITIYDAAGATGNALATLLPSAALATTLLADTPNVVTPLALNGIPASVTVTVTGALRGGISSTLPVSVVARDAKNNVIVGTTPYANAIALTSSDTSGALTFSGPALSPSTAVTLTHNGNVPSGNASSVAYSATASGVLPASIIGGSLAFTPAPLQVTCSGGCTKIVNGPSPLAVTLSEAGNYGGIANVTVTGSGCTVDPPSATMTSGSGTVNLYGNPAGGTCTVSATDSYNQNGTASPAFAAAANPVTITSPCPPGVFPVDPNGGTLYVYSGGCTGGSTVRYGSYTAYALDSTFNPISFQLDTYANTSKPPVKTQTISGNRYITGASTTTPPNIVYTGQSGATSVPWSSIFP